MITITNVSERYDPTGQQTYKVAIVGKDDGKYFEQEIVTFTHEREDGLSVCLQKASDAVRIKKLMEYKDILDDALTLQTDRQTELIHTR